MAEILNYARSPNPPQYRWLTWVANLTILYPLLAAGVLYGEWWLAGAALGHPPRPSMDDPKSIAGARWLHDFAAVFLFLFLPVGLLVLPLNLTHIITRRPGLGRAFGRLGLAVMLWVLVFVLFSADPYRVLEWWAD